MRVFRHGVAVAVMLLSAACAGPASQQPTAPEPPAAVVADPAECQAVADDALARREAYVATDEGALAMMLGAGVQASVLVCGTSEEGCMLDDDAIRKADLEETWQAAYDGCMGVAAP